VLQLNGGNAVTVTPAKLNFNFSNSLPSGNPYSVSVATQPTSQYCSVSTNGTGTSLTSNVIVGVTCTTLQYTVSGVLSGLMPGTSITLLDNGASSLSLSNNGPFQFATPINYGGNYAVSVVTPSPSAQSCSVVNNTGSGNNISANVTNVNVICSTNTFTVSGTVTGLLASSNLVLMDNNTDSLTLTASGNFSFNTAIPFGGSYHVNVSSNPQGYTCNVANGLGSNVNANVNSVYVTCTPNSFSVGGTLSGLSTGTFVQLGLSASSTGSACTSVTANTSTLNVSNNGTFSMGNNTVPYNGSYCINIVQQPVGEVCQLANNTGYGVLVTNNVTTANVTCTPLAYNVGGTVSGFASTGGGTLVLTDSTTSQVNTITLSPGATSFTMPLSYNYGSTYTVTLVSTATKATVPVTNYTCTLTGGTGTVAGRVTSLAISCL